jgi:hypothetical protein
MISSERDGVGCISGMLQQCSSVSNCRRLGKAASVQPCSEVGVLEQGISGKAMSTALCATTTSDSRSRSSSRAAE